ncbi:MAG TPA: hypothetical protein DEA73_09440 [Peptococcaceae bacterium]|nr:MAG: Accessory gene regulator B [Moorella sp. 60_41]HBT48077.1 hypothetical protein [Peptococcaceae bacterium]
MPKLNITRPTAAYLRDKLQLTPEQEEIALYGLQTILYPVTGLAAVVLTGHFFGCLATTLAAALAAGFLRLWSGGAHSGSPLTCALTSTVVFAVLGKAAVLAAEALTPAASLTVLVAGLAFCLPVVYRLAPVDSPAKPILAADYRRRLHHLSVAAVVLLTTAQVLLLRAGAYSLVLALSLGLGWQTFSLTRAGHRFATFIDKLTTSLGR